MPEPNPSLRAALRLCLGSALLYSAAAAPVKHILVMRGLPDGLTERCVRAARAIKFIPAVKDGRPVSTIVILEYNFNVY